MLNTALLTSHNVEWTTPQDFFEALNQKFHFTLDPCATAENAKCASYFTEANDGLKAMDRPRFHEPAVWSADRQMGTEGLRRVAGQCGACGLPAAGAH